MSTHDRDDFDPEDLIARARRGLLSRAEHDALAAALAESPELAAAYRAGLKIDRASALQGGYEPLIARSPDTAIAPVRPTKLRHCECLQRRRPTFKAPPQRIP